MQLFVTVAPKKWVWVQYLQTIAPIFWVQQLHLFLGATVTPFFGCNSYKLLHPKKGEIITNNCTHFFGCNSYTFFWVQELQTIAPFFWVQQLQTISPVFVGAPIFLGAIATKLCIHFLGSSSYKQLHSFFLVQ